MKTPLGKPKKSTGSLDILGNRRRSSNQYISDLRNNNAKLAHSLANEKSKFSKLFQTYRTMQQTISTQQAELRTIAGTAKAGLQKFQSALDLMIEASDYFSSVNQKIRLLCPELISVQQQSLPLASPNRSLCLDESKSGSLVQPVNQSVGASVPRSVPSTSTPTLGTAKPMVQGQIISTHPTISLRRVTIPAPLGQGTAKVPAERGVQVNVENNVSSRLSDISEHSNESLEQEIPQNISLPSDSPFTTSPPMPESHVLLERLMSTPLVTDLTPQIEDEDDRTSVIFGSLSFSSSPSENLPRRAKPSLSPPKSSVPHNFTDPDPAESSSDDENVQMQIVESKRSYLERERQLDSKEGTSWNYDEAGKFHKNPPRKRNTKKSKSPNNLSPRNSHNTSIKVGFGDVSNDSRVSKSLETSGVPQPEGQNVSSSPNLLNDSTTSSLGEADMSFTCVSPKNTVINCKDDVQNQGVEEKQKAAPEPSDTLCKEEDETRKLFVTQRSRRKKSTSDTEWDIGNESSLYSLNSSINDVVSCAENNENSPPTVIENSANCDNIQTLHNKVMPVNHQELSHKPSYVVLERLPSNIIPGNNIHGIKTSFNDSIPNRKKNTSPDKSAVRKETSSVPTRSSASKYAGSSHSPSRKRSLSETFSSNTNSDPLKDELKNVTKYKPGPKKSKQRKNDKHDETYLQVQPMSSASSSSSLSTSRNGDTSDCESIDCDDRTHRPRRNAAPVNLKEPKLGTKLRRQ